MGVNDLNNRRFLLLLIDVPNLEVARERAHNEMISVDLVKAGGALLVLDGFLKFTIARLDVDCTDQHLLAVEA